MGGKSVAKFIPIASEESLEAFVSGKSPVEEIKTRTKCSGNYVVYHLHSDLSNGVTNIDSITKYKEYISRAKECGMNALGFSEHGSVFEWWHKKCDIENAGMKYIHGIEAYLTESLDEKVRDNYHCVLIARNLDGVFELNELVSKSFCRTDNHFYYVPRISFDELFSTSDNIIITSACVGGVFGKASEYVQNKFLDFISNNKHRCFLEIGHHSDEKQVKYNQTMLNISESYGIKLIAGTDTHALNDDHVEGRKVLQTSKNIYFEGEDGWDLRFKTYDELINSFRKQNAIPEEAYMEAIENTNLLASMVEPFEMDKNTKYPHIYSNPSETFRKKVMDSMENHPYALKNHTREELADVINKEIEVYEATKSIDFMLLQTYIREWEAKQEIQCGYGRGSVSGSMIAYLLGITQMDSKRFGLNFFRFMNPARVTNADIDTDYGGIDRDKMKEFLLKDKMNLDTIQSAEIITFNTIAMKGAIRDVCRALFKEGKPNEYIKITNEVVALAEKDEEKARHKYPDVFKYVDLLNGTIVSIGTHPSGVLVSDLPIARMIGLCSTSTSDYPISMLNMKELDDLMWVKLDVLGLDNISVINNACKQAGIPRLTPDNVDLEDENVWKSIRDDTTMIFQWESNSASQYLKEFMSDRTIEIAKKQIPNFSMIKWLSFGNGLIRPACASFRKSVANGEFYDNGFDELNKFLAPEAGRIAMQETIMRFLVQFCGYSDAESDSVRRSIAKKKGTETLLPEIERRFIEYSSAHYNITPERCEEVIKPFIQIILDASAYGFSWNHSDAYSCIGYISGYLRYYYPYEFLTAALNAFSDNTDKTAEIIKYASKNGIKVTSPKWRVSGVGYYYDKEKQVIAKGLDSVKYMSAIVTKELGDLYHKDYSGFMELLKDITSKTSMDSRQLDILIKIDYFSDFGNQRELLRITEMFNDMFGKGESSKISKEKITNPVIASIVAKYSTGMTKAGKPAKSYTITDMDSILKEVEASILAANLEDLSDVIKIQNFKEYMGYVGYTSDKEEDRRKLYVLEIYPLCRKADGVQFGYSVITKSIGSGIESRFTVFNRVFKKDPIEKNDIIYCTEYKRDGEYFTLTGYTHIY